MNTLLLAPELFTTDSGIPRILRLYLKALCEIASGSDRVSFVALNDSTVDSADLRAYCNPALSQWSACNRDKKRFVRDTLRISRRADLVICGHIAQLPVAWLASILRPGLRYMLVAHGIEVWRPFSFLERLALRRASRVLCVSDFTRRQILDRVSLDSSRLVVLPNTLDPHLEAVAEPVPTDPAHPVLLTVSRLSSADRYKGIDHLIEAMPAVLRAFPGARLRVIGRGDDASRLLGLARQCGVADAIEFVGFVSDTRLREEFASCTLFALPSQKEGFGLAYLEAMAAGKPCLAADAGGAPEVVTPEVGRLVPYADVPAIASAAVSMLGQTWDATAIAARALGSFGFENLRRNLKTYLN